MGRPMLSHCAQKYAAAISDPFSTDAAGACVPRHPALPSQKIPATIKVLVQSNSTGVGFLHVMPCLANDAPGVHFSTSGFTGTSSSTGFTLADANTGTANFNTPYTSAQLQAFGTAGVRGRIISVGVRAIPVSSASTLSGLVSMYTDPDHSDCNDLSLDQARNRATCNTMRVDPRGHQMCLSAVRESELAYTPETGSVINLLYPYSTDQYSTTDTNVGCTPLKFGLGSGGVSNSYWAEIIIHYEFVGPVIGSLGTRSHVDPLGFEAVNAAASSIPSELVGKSWNFKEFVSRFWNNVSRNLQSFSSAAGDPVAHNLARELYATIGAPRGQIAITGY